jgi:hypothetical protein
MHRIAAAAIAVLSFPLASISAAAAPLRADHPLLATWQFTMPGSGCVETLVVKQNGTIAVTSGAEIAVSQAQIADRPDERGFFRWVDKILEDNGEPDCSGGVTPVGDVSVTYIHLDAGGERFALCFSEDPADCVGPFVRRRGDED